ncbi:MAG: hypothetical protein GY727_07195 [Gammaproteobacteria bacterium]|nr:hypothetical protein [Gammaproteobacteria bacterium]MCP4091657.1 hypothetical protein [Gammaproteobacteria bacterium]MCP4276153.1 hypothetical protein [Gammaproteobacteria bacterium]MCP4831787.1 hypothetical protein [Gammaproteobacteria bacterium]MCP4929723.1 hypothetical protein [Gammaproteobacteria bacterium]
MSLKYPDSQVREQMRTELSTEIADINREFLNLLTHPATRGVQNLLGLDAAILEGLRQLNPDELELVSAAPLLLVEFSPLPGIPEIRDTPKSRVNNLALGKVWQAELQGFANMLLTCIWQTARRDKLLTALFAGIDDECCRVLSDLSFCRIRQCARQATDLMQVRLWQHPQFWADLIRLARNGSDNQQIASRLSLIQLSVVQQLPMKLLGTESRYT